MKAKTAQRLAALESSIQAARYGLAEQIQAVALRELTDECLAQLTAFFQRGASLLEATVEERTALECWASAIRKTEATFRSTGSLAPVQIASGCVAAR